MNPPKVYLPTVYYRECMTESKNEKWKLIQIEFNRKPKCTIKNIKHTINFIHANGQIMYSNIMYMINLVIYIQTETNAPAGDINLTQIFTCVSKSVDETSRRFSEVQGVSGSSSKEHAGIIDWFVVVVDFGILFGSPTSRCYHCFAVHK